MNTTTPLLKQKELLSYYKKLEEEKIEELFIIQENIQTIKKSIDLQQSFLDDKYFIDRAKRKLHSLSYDALFHNIIQDQQIRGLYLRDEHLKVKSLIDLGKLLSFYNSIFSSLLIIL